MSDLGEVKLILGMRITRDRERRTLVIDQKHFAESIVDKFGMKGCNYTARPVIFRHLRR